MGGRYRRHVGLPLLALIASALVVAQAPTASAAPDGCVVLPDGAISWWPGDGTPSDDVSGMDGTANGATYAAGLVGQAFQLDGIDDYIGIPHNALFDSMASDLAVEAWVKQDVSQSFQHAAIVTKGDSTWRLQDDGDNFDHARFDTSHGSGVQDLHGTTNLNDGNWHHLAGVYDGTTKSLYVDGVLEDSAPIAEDVLTNASDIRIGDNSDVPGRFWAGLVDEVTIYNEPLSAAQVQAIHEAGALGKCKRTESKVVQPDGESNDHFGESIDIDGDTMIVGAPLDNASATALDLGSADIFVRSGGAWTHDAKLVPSNVDPAEVAGTSVAIDGDWAIVGVPQQDPPGGPDAGSAWLFKRDNTGTWNEQQEIVGNDVDTDDRFGASVDIDGDAAIIGATNKPAAYVFTRSGDTWSEQAKLTGADTALDDIFGFDVAIDADTAVVGSPQDDNANGGNAGSAYVFTRSGTVWSEQDKLEPFDSVPAASAGISVAVDGDTAVVGSFDDPVLLNGAGYVFVRSGTSWSEQQKLSPPGTDSQDRVSLLSVAIEGHTVVLGAQQDDTFAGVASGSAFLYTRSGTLWTLHRRLTPSDALISAFHGSAVAISGRSVAVGAMLDNGNGSAYVYADLGLSAPGMPSISNLNPQGPADDNTPQVSGTAEPGTTVALYSNSTCTSAVLASGTAAEYADQGITLNVVNDSSTLIHAQANDGGVRSPCSTDFVTYVEDSTDPDTTITGKPKKRTTKRKATFTFMSTEPVGATFECKLDLLSPVACDSGTFTTPKLRFGKHTFSVTATDAAGNEDDNQATHTWRVLRR